MLAAREQNGEDHQVRIREEPLLRTRACRFGRADELSEVLVLGEGVQMIEADPREARHFVFGENLLARFDRDHRPRL